MAYYVHAADSPLWRVSLRTGAEEAVLDKLKRQSFAVSPDGAQIAYSEQTGDEKR